MKNLFKKLDSRARKRNLILNQEGSDQIVIEQNELRNRLYSVFSYPFEKVMKYLRGYDGNEKWLFDEINQQTQYVAQNIDWTTRNAVLCGEVLNENLLNSKFYPDTGNGKKQLTFREAYGCATTERVPEEKAINFAQLQKKITAPILAISGKLDFIIPPSITDASYEGLHPNHQFEHIKLNGSHYLYNDSSAVDHVVDFIRSRVD